MKQLKERKKRFEQKKEMNRLENERIKKQKEILRRQFMNEMMPNSARRMLSQRSNPDIETNRDSALNPHNMSQNTIMHLMSNATSNTMMTESDYLPFDPYQAGGDNYQLANDNSASVSVSY